MRRPKASPLRVPAPPALEDPEQSCMRPAVRKKAQSSCKCRVELRMPAPSVLYCRVLVAKQTILPANVVHSIDSNRVELLFAIIHPRTKLKTKSFWQRLQVGGKNAPQVGGKNAPPSWQQCATKSFWQTENLHKLGRQKCATKSQPEGQVTKRPLASKARNSASASRFMLGQ